MQALHRPPALPGLQSSVLSHDGCAVDGDQEQTAYAQIHNDQPWNLA